MFVLGLHESLSSSGLGFTTLEKAWLFDFECFVDVGAIGGLELLSKLLGSGARRRLPEWIEWAFSAGLLKSYEFL